MWRRWRFVKRRGGIHCYFVVSERSVFECAYQHHIIFMVMTPYKDRLVVAPFGFDLHPDTAGLCHWDPSSFLSFKSLRVPKPRCHLLTHRSAYRQNSHHRSRSSRQRQLRGTVTIPELQFAAKSWDLKVSMAIECRCY